MPDFPDTLAADHLFDIHVDLEPAQAIGRTPGGGRSIILIKSGSVSGPKLSGAVLPGGGDWLVTRADGVGELDVRLTMQASDGGLIYMTYRGILNSTPEVFGRVFGGRAGPHRDQSAADALAGARDRARETRVGANAAFG